MRPASARIFRPGGAPLSKFSPAAYDKGDANARREAMGVQQNRAIIRLDYIRENARMLKSAAGGAGLCAVVKADAYGHGGPEVASALERECDMFAVALVEEGVELRVGGIAKDVLVLQPALSEEEALRGACSGLIMTVADCGDYALLLKTAEKYGLAIRCHIKLNTGMNRLGFDGREFREFCRGMLSDRICVEGIYSHFYMPSDSGVTQLQYDTFCGFLPLAEKTFGKLVKHISATGGILWGKYRLDMVRPGIGLYGYLPEGFAGALALKPAMAVWSMAVSSRKYRGGGAGYGAYSGGGTLSCVRCGYADGFFRRGGLGNVNALCMDSYVTRGKLEKYSDVCVFSDADGYAEKNGTISYEALVSVGRRAVRIYEDNE